MHFRLQFFVTSSWSDWINEDWSTRTISLGRGDELEMYIVVAKAQDTKTRAETLKEVGEWLETKIGELMVAHGYDKILPEMFDLCFTKEEIEALKRGELPKE